MPIRGLMMFRLFLPVLLLRRSGLPFMRLSRLLVVVRLGLRLFGARLLTVTRVTLNPDPAPRVDQLAPSSSAAFFSFLPPSASSPFLDDASRTCSCLVPSIFLRFKVSLQSLRPLSIEHALQNSHPGLV